MKNIIKKFIPPVLLDFYHFSLALAGAVMYRFPSRKLKVIGVTGTNGKTTVVEMCRQVLEEAGLKVASLSSVKFKIRDREWPNTLKMTMPGRLKIQKFLRQAAHAGCQYAVLEVTSEGIKQYRHRFINFDTAVFTNITPEHIERHGSFERYKEAKGKLFQSCKNIHVINLDDKNAEYFLQFHAKRKFGFTMLGGFASITRYGGEASIVSAKDIQPFNLKLPGDFNVYNALAAISVGLSHGIGVEICKRAVEKIESIPGRMEKIKGELFSVIVDYAHTPAALEKVYQTISGRKICVLGAAGGGRDKWKRPELGRIASKYCEKIILTNEDPYDENLEKILSEIRSGIPDTRYQIPDTILDRKEAIKKALSLAKPGDAVIITGKGSEPWMCVAGGKKIPWSDKEIVLDGFNELTINTERNRSIDILKRDSII
ncbi:MAG: UDP-N-acetylmuramoyl-L-alanyl-D-glutamate--2,6-diaminopimelate ligase [Candidatus Nealsonbacteria bacterium]|nr:UDP-N-acetylmuramoyl-L-alanyl-D-glutamate--2,6-diaminopimelate ligase [Candidatus Nealsonbacteria bacterium]